MLLSSVYYSGSTTKTQVMTSINADIESEIGGEF